VVVELFCGRATDVMATWPERSVDLILCDPPYGSIQTTHAWDVRDDLDCFWAQAKRVLKDDGTVVVHCAQPFTTDLIASNREMFKYSWIWVKERPGDVMNSHNKPLRKHEEIAVFARGAVANGAKRKMRYYPQGLQPATKVHRDQKYGAVGNTFRPKRPIHKDYQQEFTGYPLTVLRFAQDRPCIFPSQKPVALEEYLIRTYTSAGDRVADPYLGSGTTAVAAVRAGRDVWGVERDPETLALARGRVMRALMASTAPSLTPQGASLAI
jgi:site-specific DNA-methyltransferase (adenine-specific)